MTTRKATLGRSEGIEEQCQGLAWEYGETLRKMELVQLGGGSGRGCVRKVGWARARTACRPGKDSEFYSKLQDFKAG